MEENRCRHCHTPLPDTGPCRACGRVFVEPITGLLATNDRLWIVVRMARASALVSIPQAAWDEGIPVVDLTELA